MSFIAVNRSAPPVHKRRVVFAECQLILEAGWIETAGLTPEAAGLAFPRDLEQAAGGRLVVVEAGRGKPQDQVLCAGMAISAEPLPR